MKKKKRGKKRKRFAWARIFKDQLLSACLSDRRKSLGRDLAGYRVVRVLRALCDRKERTVVKLIVRLFGGPGTGWHGPVAKLDDRKEFVGGPCRGMLVGKQVIPVDDFLRDRAFWKIELQALEQAKGAALKTGTDGSALDEELETAEEKTPTQLAMEAAAALALERVQHAAENRLNVVTAEVQRLGLVPADPPKRGRRKAAGPPKPPQITKDDDYFGM